MAENYMSDRTDLASPEACQRHEAWLKKPPETSSDSDEQARGSEKMTTYLDRWSCSYCPPFLLQWRPFIQGKHYGLLLVPRVHRPRSLNFEHEHRKRVAKSRPASSLNLCPSYSRAESGDSFLCPESGVCTEVNTVLVQVSYLNRPIDDVRKCSPNRNNCVCGTHFFFTLPG